jgi:hypothetical protein
MEEWRKLAMQCFPELKDEPVPIESLQAITLALGRYLHEGINVDDNERIRRVISYALWMADQASSDEQIMHNLVSLFFHCFGVPRLQHQVLSVLNHSEFDKLKCYFVADPNQHGMKLHELSQEYTSISSKRKGPNQAREHRRDREVNG